MQCHCKRRQGEERKERYGYEKAEHERYETNRKANLNAVLLLFVCCGRSYRCGIASLCVALRCFLF